MYEKILVPLDGSKVGEAALEHVERIIAKMAPEVKTEVILFQVLTSLTHYVIAGELGDVLEEFRMKRQIDSLRSHNIVCGFGRVGQQVCAAC